MAGPKNPYMNPAFSAQYQAGGRATSGNGGAQSAPPWAAPPGTAGVYAQRQADAERIYQDAMTGINAGRQGTNITYGYKADGSGLDDTSKYGKFQDLKRQNELALGNWDVQRDNLNRDYGLSNSRASQDYERLTGQYADQRKQLQFNSGLSAKFDNHIPTGALSISADNAHGGYQRLLGSESAQLDQAQENSQQAGLGLRGLGAKRTQSLAFAHQGERQDYRSQLLDMLTEMGRGQRSADTSYSRGVEDRNNALSDMLAENKRGKDAQSGNYGQAEFDLLAALQGQQAGYDAQGLAAAGARSKSNTDARQEAIMSAIKAGAYTAAAPAAKKPAAKKPVNPYATDAYRALRGL